MQQGLGKKGPKRDYYELLYLMSGIRLLYSVIALKLDQ